MVRTPVAPRPSIPRGLPGDNENVRGALARMEAAGLFREPIAEGQSGRPRVLGAMAGTSTVRGDLVAPAGDADDWEALRG